MSEQIRNNYHYIIIVIAVSTAMALLLTPAFSAKQIIENRQIITSTGNNGTGEANTASNLNPNIGLFAQKSGVDLQFKSLVIGKNINLVSNSTNVTVHAIENVVHISSNYSPTFEDDLVLVDAGGGTRTITLPDTCIFDGSSFIAIEGDIIMIKKIDSGSNDVIIQRSSSDTIDGQTSKRLSNSRDAIILQSSSDTVCNAIFPNGNWRVLSIYNGTNIISESTTASNIGTFGQGIFSALSGFDLQFKKLLGVGTGISVTSNNTNVIIQNTAPESTVCNNIGSGNGLCSGGNVNIKSLIAGSGITITDTTDDYTISSSGGSAPQIGQIVGDVYFSQARSNIGTAYVDTYQLAFDEENQMIIDFRNATYFRIIWTWDYVGVGTQQVRWVNVANNAEVLYESATFTSDRDGIDSGWIAIPASFQSVTKTIEWQGKSTTAGDDPIAKGYKILIK